MIQRPCSSLRPKKHCLREMENIFMGWQILKPQDLPQTRGRSESKFGAGRRNKQPELRHTQK